RGTDGTGGSSSVHGPCLSSQEPGVQRRNLGLAFVTTGHRLKMATRPLARLLVKQHASLLDRHPLVRRDREAPQPRLLRVVRLLGFDGLLRDFANLTVLHADLLASLGSLRPAVRAGGAVLAGIEHEPAREARQLAV